MKTLMLFWVAVLSAFCSLGVTQQPATTFVNPGFQRLARRQVEQIPAPLAQHLPAPQPALTNTVRVKDITSIYGHRTHTVFGLGLVTGLSGTGGKSDITQRFAMNMLLNANVRFDGQTLDTKNLSVVRVSAEIPPFLKPGEKFDVKVAIFDDASSLYNGNLEITELKGIDGQVYALATGPVLMGGFSAEGSAGSVQKNHVTVGAARAQLEVDISSNVAFSGNSFHLLLRNKDYATAVRIASEINQLIPDAARAINSGTVEVFFPRRFQHSKMEFVVLINSLRISPDIPARVVINQKTGTIVVGRNVRLSNVMFANSNLVITTTETPLVSQPAALSAGQTAIVPRTQIEANEINSRYNVLNEAPTVGDLATVLNTLGVVPQDLIPILQSLKEEGSLQAELIIQ